MKAPNSILWILVSFAGFALFMVFFYVLIIAGKDVAISPPLYFFLIVIIALASTALLAGAMKSVARYHQTSSAKSLYVSGPAVIFFIIIYLAYVYRPIVSADPSNLTILFREAENKKIINNGTVNVVIGEYNEVRQIDSSGKALFTAISATHKGQVIEDMNIDIPGYTLFIDSTYWLDKTSNNTNITVYLKKESYLTTIRERVSRINKSANTREGVPNLHIQIETLDSLITTDSTGGFTAKIPAKRGSEIRFIVLNKNTEIYNSLRSVDEQFLSILIK